MLANDQNAALRLALAYLRKKVGAGRCEEIVRETGETADEWLFDFFHPRWRELRNTDQPYGYRIAVSKKTGKARRYLALKSGSTKRMPDDGSN